MNKQFGVSDLELDDDFPMVGSFDYSLICPVGHWDKKAAYSIESLMSSRGISKIVWYPSPINEWIKEVSP